MSRMITISPFDFEQFDILSERIGAVANLLMLMDGVDGVTYSEDTMKDFRYESYSVFNDSASKMRELYKEFKDDINLNAAVEQFVEAYDILSEKHRKVCLELAQLKAEEAIPT